MYIVFKRQAESGSAGGRKATEVSSRWSKSEEFGEEF